MPYSVAMTAITDLLSIKEVYYGNPMEGCMYITFTDHSNCGYEYNSTNKYHIYNVNIFGAEDMCHCDKEYDGNLGLFFDIHLIEALMNMIYFGITTMCLNMIPVKVDIQWDMFPTGKTNKFYPLTDTG